MTAQGGKPPFELTVGPLLPYTVYYWRVDVADSYWLCPDNEASSGVQSFTTVIPVAAEYSTWGRVKSLYR